MDGLAPAHPDVVRGIIAGEWLRADAVAPVLGAVTLRSHQVDAVRRLRAIIGRHGGALLGDEVGLGKTYVALAVARFHARPLVVAPASLRPMWLDSARRAGVAIQFVSMESLSRSTPTARENDLIVVDEAHHFRTPSSARYRSLTELTARSRVLLVSATPLHNKAGDMVALLALFLGSVARSLSDAEIARFVVRRGQHEAAASFPRVHQPVHLELPRNAGLLRRLLALPPPIPPKDGGIAAAMLTHTLVRLWASSDAALREGLRRRLAKAIGLRQALEAGRYPTRSELAAWTYAEGSVQLSFAGLLASQDPPESAGLLEAVLKHEYTLVELLAKLPRDSAADSARVAHLRALRREHGDAKIVAFSQFSVTVAMYYRALARSGGTAMLTSRGARIASGAITRREALERFAPGALNAPPPGPAEEISLLIATDLLSEGVNLQDASVVVHLDLPWTAATLEQRVGRVARLGSRCSEVFVYAIAPPAASEQLLRAESIIRRKAMLADTHLGVSRIPPLFTRAGPVPRSEVEDGEAIRRTLSGWAGRGSVEDESRPVWAAVTAKLDALVALLAVRGKTVLLAGDTAAVSTSCRIVREVVDAANGDPASIPSSDVAAVLARLRRWLSSELAAQDARGALVARTALSRRIAARLARQLSLCPRHARIGLSVRVAALHERLQRPLTLGIEREIEAVLESGEASDLAAALDRIIGTAEQEQLDEESSLRAVLILKSRSGPEREDRESPELHHPSFTAATNA
ncbi:MAG: DEAD/DEAH box helicase [Gemmatimonadaceae bacterium]|nr:DEAD/DEAH box helicase [Gemmatimonadaceae bacterium]